MSPPPNKKTSSSSQSIEITLHLLIDRVASHIGNGVCTQAEELEPLSAIRRSHQWSN